MLLFFHQDPVSLRLYNFILDMLSGDESYFSTLSTLTVLDNGTVTQDLNKVTNQNLESKLQLFGIILFILEIKTNVFNQQNQTRPYQMGAAFSGLQGSEVLNITFCLIVKLIKSNYWSQLRRGEQKKSKSNQTVIIAILFVSAQLQLHITQ